jgi:hypothetical protein
MIHEIRNIDDETSLYFDARTPYEAMKQLVYYLGKELENVQINKTESNSFLYLIDNGKTYATKMG